MRRRTLLLAALVVVGVVLTIVVRPTVRVAPGTSRGTGVLGMPARSIRAIDVELGGRRFVARRAAAGWDVDGAGAAPRVAAALDDLAVALGALRPLDRFRAPSGAPFGLDPPRGRIVVTTAHRRQQLILGALNTRGTAVYARRGRDPRVLQLGLGVVSAIERVLYFRDLARQRPEMG